MADVFQQRTLLEQLAARPDDQHHKVNARLDPPMLSMLETVTVMLSTIWSQHLHATSRMLEPLGGLKLIRNEWQVVFSAQFVLAGHIILLTSAETHIVVTRMTAPTLASEAWCTVPYQNRPKTTIVVLDDILF